MKRNVPRAKGTYIERDILESDAYWDLTGVAPQVYMVFLMKRVLSDKAFGKEFVELARSVYLNNDKRAKIKYEINEILGSNIKEIKQYEDY